MKVWGISWKAK